MGRFFEKLKVVNIHVLSKKDIKQFVKMGATSLDPKQEYRVYLMSNKCKVIVNINTKIECFTYYNRICPSLESIDNFKHKTVIIDSGAIKPITRGADVMIPGILKYADLQPEIEKNDIVAVKILDQDFLAIGISLMSLTEMKKEQNGVAIEVLHVKSDDLKNLIK
ncbi:hypothetical protein NUSPORA_00364 [Nucleospora cyclopteri]